MITGKSVGAVVLMAIVAMASCKILATAATAHEEIAPANVFCPVRPQNKASLDYSAEYKGQTVYFCCNKCVEKFAGNPLAYLANLPQFAAASSALPAGTHLPGHHKAVRHDLKHFFGAWHPLVVHFPIAFLLGALLAEIIFLNKCAAAWARTAEFLLWLGAVSAAVATVLGGLAALAESYTGKLAQVSAAHRALGIGATLLAFLAASLSCRAHGEANRAATWLYRLALLASVLSVAAAGHLGALLVHGLNHFGW